eukprot:scaffold2150_cov144-Amphora_coffeaeformis.AAC.3
MATSAGLREDTQKDLLLEIKARGGLAVVVTENKLESICEDNTRSFGEPGSTLRQQVQNKVDYLRTTPPAYTKLQQQLIGAVIDHYS